MKKVSVIIPIYNVAPYLDDCIVSVVKQEYRNLEIILIDDGSTDGSLAIARKYKEHDTRIVVLTTDHQGVSYARNRGMEIASGEYICFVDGDDYIHKSMIKILVETIEQYNDIQMVKCRYQRVEEASHYGEHESVTMVNCARMSSFERMHNLIYNYEKNYLVDAIYKKELLAGLKFSEGLILEDIPYTAELLARIKEYVLIDSVLYYYRQRNSSLTHDKNDSMRPVVHLIQNAARNDIIKDNFPELYNEFYCNVLNDIMEAKKMTKNINSGDKKIADEKIREIQKKFPIKLKIIFGKGVMLRRSGILLIQKFFGVKTAGWLKDAAIRLIDKMS